MSKRLTALGFGAVALAASFFASAQEITLRAANAFQEGTYFARNFERFIKKVNEEGKGLVQINYVGGPKAIPTFELANALRSGVVDVANTAAAFTTSVVPEAIAINYTHMTMAEMRRSGVFDVYDKLYQDKGLHYFARTGEGVRYYIYSTRRIDRADLAGIKLRSNPIYREFFQKLNAGVVQIAPGEVYTALERGVVDGYGWPVGGIFDLNWHEKTKYRVDPGFYDAEVSLVANLKKWNSLTAKQREFLQQQVINMEGRNDFWKAYGAEEKKRQAAAGIKSITFDAATTAAFVKQAYDAGWAGVIKLSPQHGPAMQKLFTKKK